MAATPPHPPASDDPAGTGADREGRIAALYADRCLVWSEGTEVVCAMRGRLKEGATPVVGDVVRWAPNPDGSGAVTQIAPRSSELTRTVADRKRAPRAPVRQVLAANVSRLVIVAALRQPPLRAGLLERFLAAAAYARIAPLLCITKLDLGDADVFSQIEAVYAPLGVPVLGTTLQRPDTFAPLARLLAGEVSVLVGHSGVGKTSLLNALAGLDMPVRAVGRHRDRGRHTTTTARLIPLRGGGFAIDSPGIREFGLHGVAPAALAGLYADFAPYRDTCRFADCLHQDEPQCAVRAAVEAGAVHPARYAGYRKLLEEAIAQAAALAPG